MANRTNTNGVTFPGAPSSLINTDITHAGLWSAAAGGTFFGGEALSNDPDAVGALGEVFEVAVGAVGITVTMGDYQDALAGRVLDGGLGTLYVSLHAGNPGTTGANEETAVTGYDRKAMSAYTYAGRTASNSAVVTFDGALQAMVDSVDMTHHGLWTAATNGTFLGGTALSNDPDEISALGEVLSFAVGALDIGIDTGGDFNDAFNRRLLTSGIGTLYLSLHSGDPGTTGADEETTTGFARQAIAAWS